MMLSKASSWANALRFFEPHGTRSISNKGKIIESQVLRKMRRKIDRLPSQGPDPANAYKHGWRLASATMLERYPIITPDVHPFQNEYLEGRFLDQQRKSRPMPAEVFLTERDRTEGNKVPSFEDSMAEQYQPGPRITEADNTNDIRSLDRALAERLYFLIKSDRSPHYRFPQIVADEDDVKMVTFAERAFKAVTNSANRPMIHYIAPRPSCHLEHIYPVSYQKKHDVYGIKIFYYRATLLDGKIDDVKNAADFIWARHCELEDFVGDEYFKGIKPALYGVGPSIDYVV